MLDSGAMDLERTKDFITATLADVAARQKAAEERADRIDQRFEKADKRLEEADKRFEKAERRSEQAEKRFDKSFEQSKQRFEQAEKRLEGVEKRLDRVDRQIHGLQIIARDGVKMLINLRQAQRDLAAAMAELATQQKRTDAKFQRCLDSMNKGQNGHKKRPN